MTSNVKWIPVTESLPEDHHELVIIPEDDFEPCKSIRVIARTETGSVTDNRRLKMEIKPFSWIWFMGYEDEEVTHWAVINFPEQ
jgi:hypothetical protein